MCNDWWYNAKANHLFSYGMYVAVNLVAKKYLINLIQVCLIETVTKSSQSTFSLICSFILFLA